MTLTKKEKTMIFILLIVMAVGGFYVYGLAPLMEERDAYDAKLKAVTDERTTAEADGEPYTPVELNKIKTRIYENRKKIAALADPGVDVNKEVLSGNLPDNSTNYAVVAGMSNYLASFGLEANQDYSMAQPNRQNGKIIYTYNTNYKCACLSNLNDFVDACARHASYYITSLSIGEVDGHIEGTVVIVITYLDV